MSTQDDIASWSAEAFKLGQEDARASASWAADGNTSPEHIRRVLRMLADGDPQADDYLPARPDLSGEWADARTPRSLFEDITGFDAHAEATFNPDAYGECVEALCEAYEQGVTDTFEPACEAALRSLDAREAR